MPFAGYKDFNDCVNKVMARKGFDIERASAYCAVIQRKVEEENTCPGGRIKSEGQGRGIGIGKGQGPIGVPIKKKMSEIEETLFEVE